MILIKVTDKGLGMSKISQKSFLKNFIENIQKHTHNVKGHGLGLA
jgi:two-component system phosphate regulon sensor histidine kinase PhoR